MRTASLWVAETADILGKQVHERQTDLTYTVAAVAETGKTRLQCRAEFAGTYLYMQRQRLVICYLQPACVAPAGWEAVVD
jgi:hypothetical protein